MSGLDARSVARNTAAMAGMRVGVSALSFACFVLLARWWGRDELGQFATLFTWSVMLQQLPLLGLHVPLIREVARRPEAIDEVGSVAAIALVVAAVAAVMVGVAGSRFYPSTMHVSFWLVGAALVPSALILTIESVLTARERMTQAAAVATAEGLLRTVCWLGLASAGFGVTALFSASLVCRLLTVVAYAAVPECRPALQLWRCRLATLRGWLSLVPTFLGIVALSACLSRLDFVILSRIGSLEQVGLYAAPYKIYEMALMMPSLLALSLLPRFTAVAATGGVAGLLRQTLRGILTAGLPCGMAMAVLAEPLTAALFGPAFRSGGTILTILALVPVAIAMDQAMTTALIAKGHERLDLAVLAWAVAAYTVLLVTLVPVLAAHGAALATAGTAVVQLLARYRCVRTRLGMSGVADVAARPVASALAMLGVVWLCRPMSLGVALLCGVSVYVALLGLMKAVTAADLRWALGALHRPREAA